MGAGRPKIPINADQVFKLAQIGAKTTEIADFFGVSADTIERNFAGELKKGRSDMRMSLRRWQLEAARNGNATMLVWLGKQMLKQLDYPDLEESTSKKELKPDLKSFEQFCIDAGYPKPFEKQLQMREFAFNETDPRMLLGARGYGKTDYVTILGVAYDIYCYGSETSNLIVTKSKSRNTAIMQEIATALRKNGCDLEKENASCVRIKGLVGKDHSAEAITIKTSMRGRHPKRILMDDPVTEEDVSEAMRNTVKTKYNEAMKLCSNMVVIGQPAHAYDLYAELRPQLKKIELPYGSIPELDHDLEAQRLAGVDESSIQKSYFLKVIPEGQIPFEHIRFIDLFPAVSSSVAFIDPSHEGGDYTAISIIAAFGQGVAVVGQQWKKAWNHCLDDIAPMLQKYNVQRLCFETNALGSMPIEILRNTFPNVGVVGRRSNNSKHSRILAAASFAHMIHLSKESGQGYIDHIAKYEYKAKHDDAPDSLATGLEWIGLVRGKE